MNGFDDRLEIYLSPGELHVGSAGTRVRSLLGDGVVIILWHGGKSLGGIAHASALRASSTTRGGGAVCVDDALSSLRSELGVHGTNAHGFVAKVFAFDGAGGRELLRAVRDMLVAAGIPVQAAESGRGNLLFDLDSGDVWLERRGPSPVRAGRAPSEVLEVYLHPGEWYFGDAGTRIKTLLGSCVAFTLWHPARLTGGMCHYMLPTRGTPRGVQAMDGRYGDEALALLVEQIVATGSRPSDFVAKMFGGGAMFETGDNGVAADNVAAARSLLALHGFDAGGDCLGGAGHRNVVFDVWSGETWLRRGGLQGRRAA